MRKKRYHVRGYRRESPRSDKPQAAVRPQPWASGARLLRILIALSAPLAQTMAWAALRKTSSGCIESNKTSKKACGTHEAVKILSRTHLDGSRCYTSRPAASFEGRPRKSFRICNRYDLVVYCRHQISRWKPRLPFSSDAWSTLRSARHVINLPLSCAAAARGKKYFAALVSPIRAILCR